MAPSSVPVSTKRADERRAAIVKRLERNGYETVVDLARLFGVSDMTIRRDIRTLVAAEQVVSVHGGVHLPSGIDFGLRGTRAHAAKQRLAQAARELAPSGGTVLIDAGTTTLEVVRALSGAFTGHVFTHSIAAANVLMDDPGISMFLLGGEVRPDTQSCSGPAAVAAFESIRADVGFLGAAAVSADGVFVTADVELGTKRALIRASAQTVLVADSSKFDHGGRHRLAGLDAVDVVVTDAQPPEAFRKACAEGGIRVVVAG